MVNSLEGSPIHLAANWKLKEINHNSKRSVEENSLLIQRLLEVAYMQGYSECLQEAQMNLFEQQSNTDSWVDMLEKIE